MHDYDKGPNPLVEAAQEIRLNFGDEQDLGTTGTGYAEPGMTEPQIETRGDVTPDGELVGVPAGQQAAIGREDVARLPDKDQLLRMFGAPPPPA